MLFRKSQPQPEPPKPFCISLEVGSFKFKLELPAEWLPRLQQTPSRVGALVVSHVMAVGMTALTVSQVSIPQVPQPAQAVSPTVQVKN